MLLSKWSPFTEWQTLISLERTHTQAAKVYRKDPPPLTDSFEGQLFEKHWQRCHKPLQQAGSWKRKDIYYD